MFIFNITGKNSSVCLTNSSEFIYGFVEHENIGIMLFNIQTRTS